MPLSCSRANSRSSYIQSWISVAPRAWVASTQMRLTMSLGKPGHGDVVICRTASGREGRSRNRSPSTSQSMAIRFSTEVIGSRSPAAAPCTSISPPVTAAATAQLPASM